MPAPYNEPTYYNGYIGHYSPSDSPTSYTQTVTCGLHPNCQATYVIINDNITTEYHFNTVSQGGTSAPVQGQGVVGVGGPSAGVTWVGVTGSEEGVLAKNEAPPSERPDDLDLLSWESIARNRFRRRGWQCESVEHGQWIASFSNVTAYVQPGQATQG